MSKHSESSNETLQFRASQDMRMGLSDAAVEYLDAMLRVLADNVLTVGERDYVSAIARMHGLSKEERRELHVLFLEQMALELSVDDASLETRETQLARLARQLGLGSEAALAAVKTADRKVEQIVADWSAEPQASTKSHFLKPFAMIASLGKGTLKARSQTVASLKNTTKLITSPHDSHCGKCKKTTPHASGVGKGFPIDAWIHVLWKARTLSGKGYAKNAAMLVVSNKKLLVTTGTSLLPKFYCSICKNPAAAWDVARIVMGAMSGHPDASNGEQS